MSLPGHPKVLATKALVFMFGGLNTRWKQVVAYYFTSDSVDGAQLVPVTTKLVCLSEDIGLRCHLVTSDMGPANLAMWDQFGIVSRKDCEVINKIQHPADKERNLFFMPDVPHVAKNLKWAFINNGVINLPDDLCSEKDLPSTTARFSHVLSLVIHQEKQQLKIAKKLRLKDVSNSHFMKMSVVSAKNFFSTETAAGLTDLSTRFKNDKMKATIWFIKTIVKWFSLMTSRSRDFALSLFNVEKFTEAIIFLEEVIYLFKNISFGENGYWKPVQNGVILATKTVIELSHYLIYERSYEFVLAGRFTNDAIENVFSCVRAPQPIPNAVQFRQNLKLNTVSQYLKYVKKGNYEEDDRKYLVDFPLRQNPKNLIAFTKREIRVYVHKFVSLPLSFKEHSFDLDLSEMKALYHICGYILSQIKRFVTCDNCIDSVILLEPSDEKYAAFTNEKDINNSLIKSSREFFEFMLQCEILFRWLQPLLKRRYQDERMNTAFFLEEVLKKYMLKEFLISFKNCHKFPDKVFKYYSLFRIKTWSPEETDRSLQSVTYASKSAAMRELALKIKMLESKEVDKNEPDAARCRIYKKSQANVVSNDVNNHNCDDKKPPIVSDNKEILKDLSNLTAKKKVGRKRVAPVGNSKPSKKSKVQKKENDPNNEINTVNQDAKMKTTNSKSNKQVGRKRPAPISNTKLSKKLKVQNKENDPNNNINTFNHQGIKRKATNSKPKKL